LNQFTRNNVDRYHSAF